MFQWEDLDFRPLHDGVHAEVMFENGYGISVVRHSISSGGRQGLFELAVLNSKGDLDYTTPVTKDTVGYLTATDVVRLGREVENLPGTEPEIMSDVLIQVSELPCVRRFHSEQTAV